MNKNFCIEKANGFFCHLCSQKHNLFIFFYIYTYTHTNINNRAAENGRRRKEGKLGEEWLRVVVVVLLREKEKLRAVGLSQSLPFFAIFSEINVG